MFGKPTQSRPAQELTVEDIEKGYEQCSIKEAHDELMREIQVRERIYLDWIRDNKLSESDARDRIKRIIAAAVWIGRLLDAPEMFTEELARAAAVAEPKDSA